MSDSIESVLFPPNIKRSKELVQYNAPYSHVLVVLNKRSGGWQAVGLEKIFYRLVGRQNVIDITEINDLHHLSEKLRHLIGRKDIKVIAGCGDGTMASIFALLDLLGLNGTPLAPLALGTGNELSGISGWGRAYVGESIDDFLDNVDHGRISTVDRWNVEFKNKKTNQRISGSDVRVVNPSSSSDEFMIDQPLSHSTPVLPTVKGVNPVEVQKEDMICFFSIGFDAEIALKFHMLRESNPSLCANRELNKLYHTLWGAKMLFWGLTKISDRLELEVDGKMVDLPNNLGCLQFFNIHSSGAGVDYFGLNHKSNSDDMIHDYAQPTINDGLIEVVGTQDIVHYLQISAYTHGRRIAQGSNIRIRILGTSPVPVQLDGNPWEQTPCDIHISRKDQIQIVLGPKTNQFRGII